LPTVLIVPALGADDLLLDWQLDPAPLLVAAVALACYSTGVRRLGRRGRHWPASRTAAFAVALAAALVATQSGIGRYDTSRFSVHMLQHLLLGLVVPLAFVQSAPVTLLLQSARPPARALAGRALRAPASRVLLHPVTGWLLFGGGIVLLYTTSLLDLAASDDLVHLGLHAHLVVSGTLFLLPLVGADVLPAPLPHPLRIVAILAAVPFHAFVAISLLSARAPIAPDAYPSLEDQRTAAGILWGAGELLTAVAVGIALYAWLQADRRAQRRADRRPQAVPAAPAHPT
jgi:cytochrome c oxidase assembly factor CtaG